MIFKKSFKIRPGELNAIPQYDKQSHINSEKEMRGCELGSEIALRIDFDIKSLGGGIEEEHTIEIQVFKKTDWDEFVNQVRNDGNTFVEQLMRRFLKIDKN
jgi:hypothetical protein